MFRAYDPDRAQLVAVKRFTFELPPERRHQLVAAFDSLVAADLTHPAIASPVAAGVAGASVFLAQDYVSAETFDHAVREYGPAPTGDALRVAAQLAGALDYAAVVNIHHGALHPGDVLLSPQETRLTGMGVAKALEAVSVAAPVRRPYAAPERLAGASWDRRADVYSLAALVYELLSGCRLADNSQEIARGLTAVADADLPALQSVFARALATDPAERFQTALAFVEALSAAVQTGESHAKVAAALLSPGEAEPKVRPTPDRTPPPDVEILKPVAPAAGDLDLRAAAGARFAEIDAAPAPVLDSPRITASGAGASDQLVLRGEAAEPATDRRGDPIPAGVIPRRAEPALSLPQERPEERSRSVWVVVTLIAGIMIGFVGGYSIRPQPPASVAASREAPTPDAASAGGREFTEGTVADPTKSASDGKGDPARVHPVTGSAAAAEGAEDAAGSDLAAPAAPGQPGRVLVRSTPDGATVSVDGRDYGQTPIAVRDLARGAHRVRVSRDGYVPAERQIVITPSDPAQSILVPLTEEDAPVSRGVQSRTPSPATPGTLGRFSGVLTVESRPVGAKVYVDNRLVGTTPLLMSTMRAGEHALRLEYDGYRRWTSLVRVVANERNRVTASLEK